VCCSASCSSDGPVVGVDLNDGHLALRRLDEHGNPVGPPERSDIDLSGSSARRDAQVRHAITRLIRYTRRHGVDTVAVDDLDFADARTMGRESMGREPTRHLGRATVTPAPASNGQQHVSNGLCTSNAADREQ
jgi:hypothetical protein